MDDDEAFDGLFACVLWKVKVCVCVCVFSLCCLRMVWTFCTCFFAVFTLFSLALVRVSRASFSLSLSLSLITWFVPKTLVGTYLIRKVFKFEYIYINKYTYTHIYLSILYSYVDKWAMITKKVFKCTSIYIHMCITYIPMY